MIAAGKRGFSRCVLLGLTLLLALRSFPRPDSARPTCSLPVPATGTIHGIVKSGNMPIPGAAVSISLASSSRNLNLDRRGRKLFRGHSGLWNLHRARSKWSRLLTARSRLWSMLPTKMCKRILS